MSFNTGGGNIAKLAYDKSVQTEEVANSAKITADTVKSQFDQVVSEAGSSNPEVVLARGNEASLNDRLTKVDEHLAETMQLTFTDLNRAQLYYKLKELDKSGGMVCCGGDSITENVWYASMMTKFPNITFVNHGHGGKTSVDFLNTYLPDLVAVNADLYILAIGTNDVRYLNDTVTGAQTPAAFVSNMSSIVTQLKAIGEVVVVNPWQTAWNDYKDNITKVEKDNRFKLFTNALRSWCATNLIPFIETNDDLKYLYHDLEAKARWSADGVHPNDTSGAKIYTDSVLYGKINPYDYIGKQYEPTGKFFYKLEIFSHYGDGFQRVWLQNLFADVVIQEVFGNGAMSGYTDPNGLIASYNSAYAGYRNKENDYPFIITFSTATKISNLKQFPQGYGKSIGRYKLFESVEKGALVQPLHSSWRLLFEDGEATYHRRYLYKKDKLNSLYLYQFKMKTANNADGNVKIKKITADKEIVGYTASIGSADVAHMFDVYAKSVATYVAGGARSIIFLTESPVTSLTFEFDTSYAVKEWEILQSNDLQAIANTSHESWVLTRSGDNTAGGNITTGVGNRLYAGAFSKQVAPSLMAGTEDLATTQTKINSLINQLKATNLLT